MWGTGIQNPRKSGGAAAKPRRQNARSGGAAAWGATEMRGSPVRRMGLTGRNPPARKFG